KKMRRKEGLGVCEEEQWLKVGVWGGRVMEEFDLGEKMRDFVHEGIGEGVVDARGFGGDGYFEV
uniref:catalase n=1 Tax=Bacillus licheniformis TaxID=1402 RepID=UPI00119F8B62